jgi:hypothetical protein
MAGKDVLAAIGIGLLLLILNFAIGFVAVAIYSVAIAPGQDPASYVRAAQWIVPWVVGIGSPLLFAIAGFVSARKRPASNGHGFALLFSIAYVLLDLLVSIPMGALESFALPATWLVMAGDFAAAQIGVLLATRAGSRSAV